MKGLRSCAWVFLCLLLAGCGYRYVQAPVSSVEPGEEVQFRSVSGDQYSGIVVELDGSELHVRTSEGVLSFRYDELLEFQKMHYSGPGVFKKVFPVIAFVMIVTTIAALATLRGGGWH